MTIHLNYFTPLLTEKNIVTPAQAQAATEARLTGKRSTRANEQDVATMQQAMANPLPAAKSFTVDETKQPDTEAMLAHLQSYRTN